MYDLRPRKSRKPSPDPQPAIRRAAQQPRTGLTNANRGSIQQPRTVVNNMNRGVFSPSTTDDTEQVNIRKCGHGNCKFCDIFDTSSTFKSTVTHRVYWSDGSEGDRRTLESRSVSVCLSLSLSLSVSLSPSPHFSR